MSLLRFARTTTTTLAQRVLARSMATGTVKWFNITKGYGFIVRNDENDGQEVFVHQTQIKSDGFRFLKEGEEVEFDIVDADRGIQATNVTGPDGIPLDRSFHVDDEL